MESHLSNSGNAKSGHQRHRSLGKAVPITSLLSNFPPLHRSAYYTRDERERPPMFFPLMDTNDVDEDDDDYDDHNHGFEETSNAIVKDTATDTDTDQEFEILVSECGSSRKSSNSDDDNAKNGNGHITLVGNSKFYTPCLTCTTNAPDELQNQFSAINEMCRRLCSDECRLRLSLAGFVPPTQVELASRAALEDHVKENLSVRVSGSDASYPAIPNRMESVPQKFDPPMPLTRPPPRIAIERKKFLLGLLTPTDSDNDSNFVDDKDGSGGCGETNLELFQVVNAVVDLNLDPNSSSNSGHDNDNADCDGVATGSCSGSGLENSNIIDPHEVELLKEEDIRERFDVAEALAKTSAMTSTSQIKQRLAARKLEMELDAQAHEKYANNAKSGNASLIATAMTTTPNTAAAAAAVEAAAAEIALASALAKTVGNDFEPPRDLLLYLVRMGSFNSAPKINNIDSQDDGLEIPHGLNTDELLDHVKHLRGEKYPPLLTRFFLKPMAPSTPSSIVETTQLASNDITDGLRYLQLNTVSRVCSTPFKASPSHIRLLQWNILSQTLGQNNDGFVRCPDEALTWENRKFLIVQEILQHNPDIVCLQEVDHFKFLQTILGTQNYEGIFFPKPDSPCLYIEENNGPDGCAIFFKRDKFELKQFETRILEVWRVQSNQVAIAANLYVKAIDKEICVCTTHLKARQGSLLSKLRNEQGRDLVRFVRNFAGDKQRPVILCGDFNAEPIEPVYATMLSTEKLKLSSAYADIKIQEIEKESNDSAAKPAAAAPTTTNNDATDADVDADADANTDDNVDEDGISEDGGGNPSEDIIQKSVQNEPLYTTWKIREDGEECHTIDYVFYTKDQFKVLNCLEFPPEGEIGKNRTPSFQYPSDHFSLVCDFEILENPQIRKKEENNQHSHDDVDDDSKMKAQ